MPPSASTLLNRFVAKARFRHLQVVIALSELGSMRRAAGAVNMTQPAISQLIRELETLLETELFFRHAKGVEPTEATRELLPVARRVLAALEDGSEGLANRLQQQGGVVRVSASPAALGGIIQGRLDSFAAQYPSIQLHLWQTADADPLGGIADSAIDVVCTREPSVIPEGWTFERCMDDRLIAVCGASHPLATNAEITGADLGASKWLLNRVGSVARDRFEDVAQENDWPQSARCQVVMHIPQLTKEMLATGKYLAVLPRSVAAPWIGSGEVRALDTEIDTPLRPLGMLWEPERAGAATRAFVAHMRAPGRDG